jgi:hypothetical protein
MLREDRHTPYDPSFIPNTKKDQNVAKTLNMLIRGEFHFCSASTAVLGGESSTHETSGFFSGEFGLGRGCSSKLELLGSGIFVCEAMMLMSKVEVVEFEVLLLFIHASLSRWLLGFPSVEWGCGDDLLQADRAEKSVPRHRDSIHQISSNHFSCHLVPQVRTPEV